MIFLHHALDNDQAVTDSRARRPVPLPALRGEGVRRTGEGISSDQKAFDDFPIFNDFNVIAGLFDDRAWIATDKRVASQMFAAFDGFKQE